MTGIGRAELAQPFGEGQGRFQIPCNVFVVLRKALQGFGVILLGDLMPQSGGFRPLAFAPVRAGKLQQAGCVQAGLVGEELGVKVFAIPECPVAGDGEGVGVVLGWGVVGASQGLKQRGQGDHVPAIVLDQGRQTFGDAEPHPVEPRFRCFGAGQVVDAGEAE